MELTIEVMGDYFCGTTNTESKGMNDCIGVTGIDDGLCASGRRERGGVIKEILHTKAPSNFI